MKKWFTFFLSVLFFAIQGFAQLQFSSSSVDFGAHVITSTSTLEVTLSSQINQNITLSGLSAPFACSPVTFPIVIGEQKTITISFNPQTLGGFPQTLTATGSIWGTTQCSVYGESTDATVTFSQSYLDFGNVLMTTYQQQMVTVQSDISQIVTLSDLSSPFTVNPAVIELQANQPANVYISFNPQTPEYFQQYLNASGSFSGTASVNIYGSAFTASVNVYPQSCNFDPLFSGQTQTIDLLVTTDINQVVNLSGLSGVFSLTPASLTLTGGDPETIHVTFSPENPGVYNQTLNLQGETWASTSISVYGECIDPAISVSPSYLNFGEVGLGSTSSLSLTIYNTGNGTLNCNFIHINDHFSLSTNGLSVSQGSSNSLTVYFSPEFNPAELDTLFIESNDPDIPLMMIPMTGQGKSLISGEVCGTWYKVNSPYNFTGTVTVPENCSLTIEPGVVVNIEGHSLTVNGKLSCEGLPTDSIVFNGWGSLTTSIKYSSDTIQYISFRHPTGYEGLTLISYGITYLNSNINCAIINNNDKSYSTFSDFNNWSWSDKWTIFNAGNGDVSITNEYWHYSPYMTVTASATGTDFGVVSNPILITSPGKVQVQYEYKISNSYSNSNTQLKWRVNHGNWNVFYGTCYGCTYGWSNNEALINHDFQVSDTLEIMILNQANNSNYYYQSICIDNFNLKIGNSVLDIQASKITVTEINNYGNDQGTTPSTKIRDCNLYLTNNIDTYAYPGSILMENCIISHAGTDPIKTNYASSNIELKNISISDFIGNAVSSYGQYSNIKLNGCTISNTYGNGRAVYSSGNTDKINVQNCQFYNLSEGIIAYNYLDLMTVKTTTISSCSSDAIRTVYGSIQCDSIQILNIGGNGISHHHQGYAPSGWSFSVSNSEIRNCTGHGINLYGFNSSINLTNTLIRNNQGSGIYIENNWGDNPTINVENCFISKNYHGFYLYRGNLNVVNSIVNENLERGISLSYGSITLFGSEVSKNNSNGIYAPNVTALNTVVSSNTNEGISASNIEANYLTCVYNKKQGLYCNNNQGALYNSIVCMNNNSQTNQFYGMTDIKYSKYIGNPQLADSLGHLLSTSPCIDAADPLELDAYIPYGLKTIRADMGAYGGPGNWIWGGSPVPEDGKPEIEHVVDLPQDQGKMVGIQYQASIFDYGNTAYTINRYSFWRELDVNGKENIVASKEPTGLIFEKGDEYWEYVGEMPGSGFEHYGFSAPTLGDSTAAGIFWSKYIVVAHATQGNYWVSQPDSGYSVDNLAPMPPANLAGTVAGNSLNLNWSASPDIDVQYYAVYRSEDGSFGSEPLTTTVETELPGIDLTTDEFKYAVAAYDYSGNKGALSNVVVSPVMDQFAVPQGWSGISSWIAPLDPEMETVVSPLGNDLVILYNQSGMYWPGQNINTLTNWNRNSGYVVKMAADQNLPFIGYKDQNLSHYLTTNWQILPVLSACPTSTNELQNQLGSNFRLVKEIAGNRLYWPAFGIQTLGYLEPGKAYYLNTLTGAGSFTYPPCDLKSSVIPDPQDSPVNFSSAILNPEFQFTPTPNSHIIAFPDQILKVLKDLNVVVPGDIIAAFTTNGICAGSAVVESLDKPFALTVFGDDNTTDKIEGLNEGEPLTFRVYKTQTGETCDAAISFDHQFPNADGRFGSNGISAAKELKQSPIGIHDQDLVGVQVFPNPGNGVFQFSGLSNGAAYEVINVKGIIIKSGRFGDEMQIDLTGKPAGVYQVKVIDNETGHVVKLVLE